MLHKLQYITQGKTPRDHLTHLRSVLDAGVTLVQLRLKNCDEAAYTEHALQAAALCRNYSAALIINDNPVVAKHCHAQALHLGLTDMKVEEAKKIVPGAIIGGTANTFEHIRLRCAENVDYIGLGPYRFTSTKEKLSPILGAEGYHTIIAQMRAEKLTTPVYAIGGIELKDIPEIMRTGVYGIAVSGMLTNSDNKEKLVREITNSLYHA